MLWATARGEPKAKEGGIPPFCTSPRYAETLWSIVTLYPQVFPMRRGRTLAAPPSYPVGAHSVRPRLCRRFPLSCTAFHFFDSLRTADSSCLRSLIVYISVLRRRVRQSSRERKRSYSRMIFRAFPLACCSAACSSFFAPKLPRLPTTR